MLHKQKISQHLSQSGLDCAFGVWRLRFSFFFFLARIYETAVTVHVLFNEQQQQSLTFLFFSQSVHIVYCLRTHKFYFSTTFSLKMSPTILFTHFKIILLQYFSVFSFSFQLYPNGPLVSFYIMLVGSPHLPFFWGLLYVYIILAMLISIVDT